jgi:hypothetical protein
MKNGIIKANNQPIATRGLLTTTGGLDLLHTLPNNRTAKIIKIMFYQNTGANVTLIFGTSTNLGVAVPLFPTILAISGIPDFITLDELPDVEFIPDLTAGAAGLTGNIFVTASAAACLVRLTVEEY